MNFTITSPRQILVGGGVVARIAETLATFGLSRPLVVSDPFMVSSGLIQRCLEPLAKAGIRYAVFSDTVPEPTDDVVEAGVAHMRAGEFDCLIGFGGGSPIDTAKAMAILAAGGGAMADYKVPHQADLTALPVIAIPTTLRWRFQMGYSRRGHCTADTTEARAVVTRKARPITTSFDVVLLQG
jgi:alcohol dehydrogenase class IV